MKEKFINYCLSQVGYKEGKNNDNKYGVYFGMNNEPWCALFVSYCARMCDIPESIIPNYAGCGEGYRFFKNKGEIFKYPESGDIVFFKPTVSGATSSHTGVVVSVSEDYIKTVEGNASSNTDGVYLMTYSKNYNKFLGFARPAYIDSDNVNVLYQTYDNNKRKWLPVVTNYNNSNIMGYAGNFGNSVGGIRCRLSDNSKVLIKSHLLGGNWLSEIDEWNDTSNGYSGIKGKKIDAVMIKSDKRLKYRVHLLNSKRWLSWVDGYDMNDYINGYAGNIGEAIDAIQIKI